MGRKSHNGKYQQEDRDYLKKTKTLTQKTYMYLHVHCCAIYNSRDMGTTLMPINGQMDKERVVYIHDGILLSHKKNEILSFSRTWMSLEGVVC